MNMNSKKSRETVSEKNQKNGRRYFLKKAVYSAPTVIALGTLLKPKQAKAGFGGPPSDPGGGWGGRHW